MKKEKIDQILQNALDKLQQITTSEQLHEWHNEFLGRKRGKFTDIMKSLSGLSEQEKKVVGPAANQAKQKLATAYDEKESILQKDGSVGFDVTLPSQPVDLGHLHLITQTIERITDIFKRIGFKRVSYPEVETDYYAFESLNFPQDHPARDDWETYFIDNESLGVERRVLTPHTSSGQVREMRKGELPIRMINISKCYRRQSDVSHTQMFHQFEGLYIDESVSISHLKGVMDYFAKAFFGPERKIRLRPYDFQFTEPSFEIDISCAICDGQGCKMCKEGWLELGGSGMVHPNVLKEGKIDTKKYNGFAFGWGVERVALMQEGLGIPDLRDLYRNDLRFLEQF